MKIYTITCHDVYNHGASLQAYALMKYLSEKGNDVEIIDYKPDYLRGHYSIFSINNPRWSKNMLTKIIYLILKVPTRILPLKRKKEFDTFKEERLKVSNTTYCSNEELKNNLPDGDAYICGSDQIWNSLHMNGRDEAFYLNFVPNNKIKLAYAASFAIDEVEDKYKFMIKKNLESFNGIGVREKSGLNILEGLGIHKGINVLDPVFLLDKSEWNKIANQHFNEKYILVYDFDNNILIKKIAEKIARENNYKIYSINNYKTKYADRNFNYKGPESFVSLVKNAEFVVSNSFHSVVFSVVYNKEFIIVNRSENINTRMRDLLSLLELSERLVANEKDIEKINLKIDYEKVNKLLKSNLDISKGYLDNILNK